MPDSENLGALDLVKLTIFASKDQNSECAGA